jgi:hypothetical protein
VNRADRRVWGAARSLAGLGELTAQWLEGAIDSVPGYCGGPAEETRGLVPVLAAANRAGFVTDCSQPGGRGPGWEQRAAVSGFADPATWVSMWEVTEGLPLMRIAERATCFRASYRTALPVSCHDGRVVTRFGAALPRRDLRDSWVGYGVCHRDAVRAVCGAWQITLIDAGWGREDSPLWPALERFATPDGPAGRAASCICPLPYCPGGEVPCVAAGRCMRPTGGNQ